MAGNPIVRRLAWLADVGAHPGEGTEAALERTLLIAGSMACAAAGVIWGTLYIAAGALAAGLSPLAYTVISLGSTALFAVTRRYRFYRNTQLLLILLLPWSMMLPLGTFANSSAGILWSSLCPIGALLLDGGRGAARWFLAFVALVVIAALLERAPETQLPAALVTPLFVMNIVGVLGVAFLMLRHFVNQKNKFQQQSEALLLSILPREISEILKTGTRTIADHFAEASILFADCVQFTPLSARMDPRELVAMLDEVFLCFDQLVEKHGAEKIKTIGDCYMVGSGVPRPRADHAKTLARLALDMRVAVSQRTFRGQRLAFRIGMNSGPVIAGVIGRKRFIYDLWGDAVNTASRMEAYGASGAIQITRATYELIADEFDCEPRGAIEIKGKGEMEVWHLLAERASG